MPVAASRHPPEAEIRDATNLRAHGVHPWNCSMARYPDGYQEFDLGHGNAEQRSAGRQSCSDTGDQSGLFLRLPVWNHGRVRRDLLLTSRRHIDLVRVAGGTC